MGPIPRRQFARTALGALGAAMLTAPAAAQQKPAMGLPTVRWGKHDISRLLVGHNPIKGVSHYSAELSQEMRQWFAADPARARQLLRRCEQLGINTCQMGGPEIEKLLQAYWAEGGRLQWIATFYSTPGRGDEELARILRMTPRPIGIQQHGNVTDRLMREGQIDRCLENLKRFRDAGVLVGLCSHNHEVIDYAEQKGWDVDFYQCSFYRVGFGLRPASGEAFEAFDDRSRLSMVKTVRQVSKPCLVFKVLAANRHCGSPAAVEAALRFALENIKPTDAVLLGMWQKYKDQVAENVGYARRILGL